MLGQLCAMGCGGGCVYCKGPQPPQCDICGCIGSHGCMGPKVMTWKEIQDLKKSTSIIYKSGDENIAQHLAKCMSELRILKDKVEELELRMNKPITIEEHKKSNIGKMVGEAIEKLKCTRCTIEFNYYINHFVRKGEHTIGDYNCKIEKFPFCPYCGNKNE